MKRLIELPFLFRVVAVLELVYASLAILTPPEAGVAPGVVRRQLQGS